VSVVLGETGIDDREINTMKSLEKTDMTSRESFTSPGPDNSVHSNDKAAYKKKESMRTRKSCVGRRRKTWRLRLLHPISNTCVRLKTTTTTKAPYQRFRHILHINVDAQAESIIGMITMKGRKGGGNSLPETAIHAPRKNSVSPSEQKQKKGFPTPPWICSYRGHFGRWRNAHTAGA